MTTKIFNLIESTLQFIAVFHHIYLWAIFPIFTVWLPIYLLFFTQYWWTVFLYTIWFFYDLDTPASGSRNWSWYKNSSIWHYFAAYFPIKLVKTSQLPADRNYIMGCHPHGIFSIGAFTHLSTSATGFSNKFPGLKPSILTLSGQFWFPLRREIGIGLGGVESSSKSLKFLLKNPKSGTLAGIVIGGAEEVLDAKPDNYDLKIMGRFGFCKIALETGASLVPSYSFGENDVYDQHSYPRGSRARKIQSSIKKFFGLCPPFILGYSWFLPLLPRKKPITTVIGTPIEVELTPNPTREQIYELHQRYCSGLVELFEAHKAEYNIKEDVHLNFY